MAGAAPWLLAVLILGASAAMFYWFQQEQSATTGQFAAELKELNGRFEPFNTRLEDLRGQLSNIEEGQNQTASELKTLRRKQQSQSESLTQLAMKLPQDSEDWILSEVQYLLFIAEQRLNIEQDIPTALAAMQAAGQRLASLESPGLKPVREQLIKDMNELRAVSPVDITGLALNLADLLGRADGLPMKGGEIDPSATTTEAESPPDGAAAAQGWREALEMLWRDIKGLVSVTQQDFKAPLLFEPKHRGLIQESLRLELSAARLAALRRDTQSLQSCIDTASGIVSRYYDTGVEQVQGFLDSLAQMKRMELAPAMPDIEKSRQAVLSYFNERAIRGPKKHRDDTPSKPSATEEPPPPAPTEPPAPAVSEEPTPPESTGDEAPSAPVPAEAEPTAAPAEATPPAEVTPQSQETPSASEVTPPTPETPSAPEVEGTPEPTGQETSPENP
jgi:uroporphyrin-3 C-methyltransferase